MSIQPTAFKAFYSPLPGRPAATRGGTESFSSIMKAVADGNPSKEDIKTLTAYLQWRLNESFLSAFGGGNYTSPWSGYGQSSLPMQRPAGTHAKPTSLADGSLSDIVAQASSTYKVDADLIAAVIRAESGGNSGATSPKGAMGLMQLMPATAKDLGVTDPYDPKQNVMAGAKYLKGLLDRYGGNRDLALAAYNWGMGNLEKSHRSMPQETVNYVARIKKYLEAKA